MPDESKAPDGMKPVASRLASVAQWLRQQRQPFESLFQRACEMHAPELRRDVTDIGRVWGQDLHDGYPQLALDTWSKGIPGNMVYRDAKWLTMRLNVRKLANEPVVKSYCEELSEVVFWAARRSNFYRIQPEFARHAGAMGGYLFPVADEETASVRFILENPWKVWISRDGLGRVVYCMREVTQSVEAWQSDLGDDAIPDAWQQLLKGANPRPMTPKTLLHILIRNQEHNKLSKNVANRRWISVYFEEGSKTVVSHSTIDHGVLDWCVRRPAGWDYPTTPAMFAYIDAVTNDTLTEALTTAAMYAASPAMRVMNRLRNIAGQMPLDKALGPGGLLFVDRPDDVAEQLSKVGQWPVGDAERERVKSLIDRWWGVPFFEMLTRMEGTPPTAYQIRQLQAEKATLLGPEVGSYREDALDTAVDVMLDYEEELTGDLPERPAILDEYLRQRVLAKIERLGLEATEEAVNAVIQRTPLATIEAVYNGVLTAIETETVQNRSYLDGISLVTAAADIWPEAPLVGKAFPVIRHALEALNWSGSDLRTEREFQKVVDEMNERQAATEAAQQIKELSASYQAAAKGEQIERT